MVVTATQLNKRMKKDGLLVRFIDDQTCGADCKWAAPNDTSSTACAALTTNNDSNYLWCPMGPNSTPSDTTSYASSFISESYAQTRLKNLAPGSPYNWVFTGSTNAGVIIDPAKIKPNCWYTADSASDDRAYGACLGAYCNDVYPCGGILGAETLTCDDMRCDNWLGKTPLQKVSSCDNWLGEASGTYEDSGDGYGHVCGGPNQCAIADDTSPLPWPQQRPDVYQYIQKPFSKKQCSLSTLPEFLAVSNVDNGSGWNEVPLPDYSAGVMAFFVRDHDQGQIQQACQQAAYYKKVNGKDINVVSIPGNARDGTSFTPVTCPPVRPTVFK